MKHLLQALLFLLGITSISLAQNKEDKSMADCPTMKERGDKGMGFAQDKAIHHFYLTSRGGTIDVSTNDPNDTVTREQIRRHLRHLARMFAQGNFAIPMFVHGQIPPGTDVMKKEKSFIRYRYQETQGGGQVKIATSNLSALKAVHRFLQFQIEEHRTGDPGSFLVNYESDRSP